MSTIYHEEGIDLSASNPWGQFENEVEREQDRVIAEQMLGRKAKNKLIPFDASSDFYTNAQNYVRSNWVKEGIWREEWGPASSPDSLPFCPTSHAVPSSLWGHEKQPKPAPPSHELASHPKPLFPLFGGMPKKNEATLDATTAAQPEAPIELDAPSRPINRFRSLMAREVEWLRVHLMDYANATEKSDDELEAEAYTNIKDFWKECRIWRKNWGPIPGLVWAHEDFHEYIRKQQAAKALAATERKAVGEECLCAKCGRETRFPRGRTSSPENRPAPGHKQPAPGYKQPAPGHKQPAPGHKRPATSQGTQTELPDAGAKPSPRTDGKVVHAKTSSAKRAEPTGDSSEAGSIAKKGLGTAETTKLVREGPPAKRKRL
ncbi:hypothetical protein BGZ61DRAFT_526609 [Ilyonectria robusta]|uniref:uncharacterized protein n=1 Tax=Ilyonectria robusta TaxID=1079257 RepID=UPI001E8CDE81|nr:uncharacterized protein BGZ61DRAFT_526609 [Ilyonectria robusta]KAH8735540.1 hypothetical protein BGZ61DRAFT_526609 [Ilyonectria robusta]